MSRRSLAMGVKRVRPKFQTLILNRPSSSWSAFFLFSFNRKLWTPRACVGTNLAWIVIDFSEVHWCYCALSESLAFNSWWRTLVFPLRCARGETNNNTVWCLFFVRLFLILFLGSQRSCFSFFLHVSSYSALELYFSFAETQPDIRLQGNPTFN